MKSMTESDRLRFYTKVAITLDGCWEWVGAKFSETNYGQFDLAGKKYSAHRLMYQLEVGPIPPGAVIRHRCDNPGCVRPDHLEPGTHKENAQDRQRRGRTVLPARRRISPLDVHNAQIWRRRGATARRIAEQLGITIRYARRLVEVR